MLEQPLNLPTVITSYSIHYTKLYESILYIKLGDIDKYKETYTKAKEIASNTDKIELNHAISEMASMGIMRNNFV